jgi:hypothetical protein
VPEYRIDCGATGCNLGGDAVVLLTLLTGQHVQRKGRKRPPRQRKAGGMVDPRPDAQHLT